MIPGCGIPRLQQPCPGPCLPQSFFLPEAYSGTTTLENSSQLGIAEFFNDSRLFGLIDQALVGNQQLRILAQDIAIANNEIMRRRGAYLPFMTLGTGASLNKLSTYTPEGSDLSQIMTPAGGPFPNPLPDFLVAADVTWQIDIWRQLRNARDAGRSAILGAPPTAGTMS